MSVEIRRGTSRFVTREEGRDTRHSFSFGEHYDADNVRFGALVCHDDHRLRAGAGFSEHEHRDLEIVSWVLSGTLVHSDGSGATSLVAPGTAQLLSAGSGVRHAEVAGDDAGPTRFVQAWLVPDETGTAPSYATASPPAGAGLVPVASGQRADAPLRLGTASATFWVARLAAGETVALPDEPLQHVFVATGALARSSLAQPLAAGDAFRITEQSVLPLTAAVATELLVWTFR